MHFKKTPPTHKLGVLYVVDSVARQWVDQAKKSGQVVGPGAKDGTFAAGVNRITELLPSLMSDILGAAPPDQRPKIKKLIEIWERSNTFPAEILAPLKTTVDAPPSKHVLVEANARLTNARGVESTTPINSPKPGFIPLGQPVHTSPPTTIPPAASATNTSAILEALKKMNANQTAGTPNALSNLLGIPSSVPPSISPVNHGQPSGPAPHPFAAFMGNTGGQLSAMQPLPGLVPPPLLSPAPAPGPGVAPIISQDTQQTLQLVQAMMAQGIPPDQWAAAINVINMQKVQAGQATLPMPPPLLANSFGQAPARDTRSPPGFGSRKRSRSPEYSRHNGGHDYRQRSPQRRRRSPSPVRPGGNVPPPGPKNISHDPNLPPNTIKVLSRTLFVGGVTTGESHLRSLFEPYGAVQTCLVNVDKRHAFIKMYKRTDAERARDGMEEYKDSNGQLRTKWGVGFGPRDCSDYAVGVSVIPMAKLTDADRKWLVSAEYGGTGGAPITAGMVVEEPDIEIGAGVSSKAMSRRIATDQGGRRGPQSSNKDVDNRRKGRFGDDPRDGNGGNPNMMPLPPAGVNGMGGLNMPMMNFPMLPSGMPMLPPGFMFPLPGQQGGNSEGKDGGDTDN